MIILEIYEFSVEKHLNLNPNNYYYIFVLHEVSLGTVLSFSTVSLFCLLNITPQTLKTPTVLIAQKFHVKNIVDTIVV